MNEDKSNLILNTLSLVGTQEQLDKLWEDLAKAGWKLKFQGNSGTWLGEPIYSIHNINSDSKEKA